MQFRVTQKCLLVKYRETRPQPIEALSVVLESTLDTILELADEALSVDRSLKKSACALSCAVQLLHCCIRCVHHSMLLCYANRNMIGTQAKHRNTVQSFCDLRVELLRCVGLLSEISPVWCLQRILGCSCRCPSMESATLDMITSHISTEVSSDHEIGWEECTEAALVDLLRGPLSRTAKERGMIPTINGPLTQCDTLKNNLQSVVSRLEAGMVASEATADS